MPQRRRAPAGIGPLGTGLTFNTEPGLPLWNHLLFFIVSWAIQVLGPRWVGRPRRAEGGDNAA